MAEITNQELMTEIGAALKRFRQQKGITQKELGEKIGRPQGTITRIETAAVADTHIGLLYEMTSAIGISLDELFNSISLKEKKDRKDFSLSDIEKKMQFLSEDQRSKMLGIMSEIIDFGKIS